MEILPHGTQSETTRTHGEVLVVAGYTLNNLDWVIFVDAAGTMWRAPSYKDAEAELHRKDLFLGGLTWEETKLVSTAVAGFMDDQERLGDPEEDMHDEDQSYLDDAIANLQTQIDNLTDKLNEATEGSKERFEMLKRIRGAVNECARDIVKLETQVSILDASLKHHTGRTHAEPDLS